MTGPLKTFQRRLLEWYDAHRRDLPWRVPMSTPAGSEMPPPYHVFVSEAMLQQTQVATVVPYFNRFIQHLPSFAALAAADEQEVLRLWQGLGYYSRARNLHAAAKAVVGQFAGQLPSDVDALLKLPGVGRYTAGAVASIAFGRNAPILDGNVARVLCRIDRIESDPRSPPTRDALWRRAEELLPDRRAGDFNSALMELGATVCTPRSPKCLLCPVRRHCEACAAGVQERIPPPRAVKVRPLVRRWTFCIHREGRWLLEQRPLQGRWAGLWQFVTIEHDAESVPSPVDLRRRLRISVSRPKPLGSVEHGLSHRQYEFSVFICDARGDKLDYTGGATPRAWVALQRLGDYPLPRPHLRIARLIEERAFNS